MARILVTGAGGFIGRALCPALAARGHQVVAGLRAAAPTEATPVPGIEQRPLGDVFPGRDWSGELADINVIVHLAQRAHRPAENGAFAAEPAAAAALAAAAARSGVKRLIYLSSIKAMGESTPPLLPFRADQPPSPVDVYGRVKLATERELARIAGDAALDLVVVRSPLVYGPGVAGNFRALVRLAGSGLPLPFAKIDNRRSLISVNNLVDLIATAIVSDAAAGGTWLAADGSDLSTPALIRLLAQGQGCRVRLFGVPERAFVLVRQLPAIGPVFGRLTLSLQIDASATRVGLDWRAPIAAEDALVETARAFARGEQPRLTLSRSRSR